MRAREEEQLLTPTELGFVVLAVLPIFLFWNGPIWKHPFEIDTPVYWSYAPIPLLVLLVLLRRKALTLAGFLVNTINALGVKYMITVSVACSLWAILGPPVHAAPAHDEQRSPAERASSASDVALEVAFDSRAISTTKSELAQGQAIGVRSNDGSLHTLRAKRQDGTIAFNVPVIPGRAPRAVIPKGVDGPLELACTVHPRERHATILVR